MYASYFSSREDFGFWPLESKKICPKKKPLCSKYENFGTFQWCLGKCIYIYIYTCLGICMVSNLYLHVRSELYIHNIYIYTYTYIMYICMHVTACIFGWHKATSLIENLGNNSAFPNLHVSLPTGISHQLIMVEEVPSSVISPSNLCTKNRNCLKPVQRIRYTRLCMKKNRKSKHGQAIWNYIYTWKFTLRVAGWLRLANLLIHPVFVEFCVDLRKACWKRTLNASPQKQNNVPFFSGKYSPETNMVTWK